MSATFSYTPDYTYIVKNTYNTLITQFENLKEQRRPKVSSSIKEFHLEYDHIDKTTKDNILAFFDTRSGSYESFSWTCPLDDTSYTVRFKKDDLEIEEVADEVFNLSFDFIEVV